MSPLRRIPGILRRELRRARLDGEYGGPTEPADIDLANIVTSRVDGVAEVHFPVIDIDFPCTLVESSPGKHHLYIDHPVAEHKYWAMLQAMADAGIVQQAYVGASRARGFSCARLPWVKKEHGPFKLSTDGASVPEADWELGLGLPW